MTKNVAPWKKRQEIPDAQVRDAADNYEAASRVLYKALRHEAVVLALMNTLSVAVELYLKSLASASVHRVEDPPFEDLGARVFAVPDRQTHELKDILDSIPEDVRKKPENAFAKWPGNEKQTLRRFCDRYEGLFVSSRYPFDDPEWSRG